MSEFSSAPAPTPDAGRRCALCGSPSLSLAPDICVACTNGPASGPLWQPGEVGYEIRMSADQAEAISGIRPVLDPFVAGPLRSRETAEDLARVWGAQIVEVVPVPPQVHEVGGELVTAEGGLNWQLHSI